DDAATDLVGGTPEAVAAAWPLADCRGAADPRGGAADDRRTVADARAGAARHPGRAGLHARTALIAGFRRAAAVPAAALRRAPGVPAPRDRARRPCARTLRSRRRPAAW